MAWLSYDNASRPRHRRSAKERRDQRVRAAARTVSRVIQASAVLAAHRGCKPGRHLGEMACLLAGLAMPERKPEDMHDPAKPLLQSDGENPTTAARSSGPALVTAGAAVAASWVTEAFQQLLEDTELPEASAPVAVMPAVHAS